MSFFPKVVFATVVFYHLMGTLIILFENKLSDFSFKHYVKQYSINFILTFVKHIIHKLILMY
jgi:hypothetical protein